MTDLLLPPEVTEQLQWEVMDSDYIESGAPVRVLAPRQVVALPDPLTVPCPCSCHNEPNSVWNHDDCGPCGGDPWEQGVVPLPDGIYQLVTERVKTVTRYNHRSGLPWSGVDFYHDRLGSPVRVTHKPWEKVTRSNATSEQIRPVVYVVHDRSIHIAADLYDRLAARPHDGGVLLLEAT